MYSAFFGLRQLYTVKNYVKRYVLYCAGWAATPVVIQVDLPLFGETRPKQPDLPVLEADLPPVKTEAGPANNKQPPLMPSPHDTAYIVLASEPALRSRNRNRM